MTSAGVDPALVMHYFKNKEGLFDAVADTLAILPDELGKMTSGRQFVTTYFGLWEDPVTGPRLRALVRAGIGSEHATNRLREFMMQQLSSVGRDDMIHTGNFALVGSSLMGIAIARYLVEMPRFEGMTTEELVDNIAPAVDALLGQAAPKA